MNYFWISIADEHTGKNIGAVIIPGETFDEALTKGYETRCLPEGCLDMEGVKFDMNDHPYLQKIPLCTLFTRDQMIALGVRCSSYETTAQGATQ